MKITLYRAVVYNVVKLLTIMHKLWKSTPWLTKVHFFFYEFLILGRQVCIWYMGDNSVENYKDYYLW